MMKRISFWALVAASWLAANPAATAGPRVGNGGGTWVCQEKSGPMRWMQLVDLFEAKNEYGLELIITPATDPWSLLRERMDYLRQNIPAVAELLVIDEDGLRTAVRMVPEKNGLTRIDDDEVRVRPRPESCQGGILYYGQLANFTEDGRLLIASDLWNDAVFSVKDQAALLLHEVIYKSMRDRFGDRTSSRARALVALLFSNLPAEEINRLAYEFLKRTSGISDRPEVLRAPFRLVCEGRLDSAEEEGRAESVFFDVGYGSQVRTKLGQVAFAVEADAATHEPVMLEITDMVFGARASVGRKMIHAAFWKEARVSLELEFTGSRQRASLMCEARAK